MRSVPYPRSAPRLSALDAAFHYLDPSHSRFQIGCLAILDGPLTDDELVRCVEDRLGSLRRFAERIEPAPIGLAHPSWEPSPLFQVRDHVHRWSVPGSGSEQDLNDLVGILMTHPLDRQRPLWEMHLLAGLPDGRSALLYKAHHCMIDGVSGVGLLDKLLDREAHPPPPVGRGASASSAPSAIERLLGALWDATERPSRQGLRAARAVLRGRSDAAQAGLAGSSALVAELGRGWMRALADPDPALPWCGALGPRRTLRFAQLPMDEVGKIRRARGGTLNDVVLTVLAGGVERYLRSSGAPRRRRDLTALVPVSLRSGAEAETLGNRIVALRVPLVLGAESEPARLRRVRAVTEALKLGTTLQGTTLLLDALDLVPAPLFAWAADRVSLPRGTADLVATNVPGPREPRFLAGRPVRSLYPVVPIVDGMGLGIAVLSYADHLQLGLHAAANLVPDLEKLEAGILEAFQALGAEAHGP